MEDRAQLVFTFGIIADIQYADIEDGLNYLRTRKRFYRNSLQLLRNATCHWEEQRVRCVLQLGDIIDGFNKSRSASEQALDTVIGEFDKSSADVHHVWGQSRVLQLLQGNSTRFPAQQRSESRKWKWPSSGWHLRIRVQPRPRFRFMLLDAYDISVIGRDESSEKHKRSWKLLQEHNSNPDLNQPPGAAAKPVWDCSEGSGTRVVY